MLKALAAKLVVDAICLGCELLERALGPDKPTSKQGPMPIDPSKPLRAIDEAFEGNAHSERVRLTHGYYTTALDGLLRGARDAHRLGHAAEAADMDREAERLDAEWALHLDDLAAKES